MPLGDDLRGFAREMEHLIDAFEQVAQGGVQEIARVAVETYLKPALPVDTGATRDAARWEPLPDGARIVIGTDYSSFIFAKGDRLRTPIYLELLPWAVQMAVDEVGLEAAFEDLTAEYFGQGRTTAHLTGTHRKMIQHTPADQVAGWRKSHPELIETISIVWNGSLRDVEVVPSDTIAAGGAGSRTVRPRRK